MRATLQTEIKLTRMYLDLLQRVEECAHEYAQAGVQIPSLLQGLNGQAVEETSTSFALDEDDDDEEDDELLVGEDDAENDYEDDDLIHDNLVTVPLSIATPTTVLLAVMRKSFIDTPQSPVQLSKAVAQVSSRSATGNTLYNVIKRLEDSQVVRRTPDGFMLNRPDLAPIISGESITGRAEYMQSTEISYARRESVLDVLRRHPQGLQAMQIVSILNQSAIPPLATNKDVMKLDLAALEATGQLRRRADDSRRWVLTLLRGGDDQRVAEATP